MFLSYFVLFNMGEIKEPLDNFYTFIIQHK